jgi:hypothetical protein
MVIKINSRKLFCHCWRLRSKRLKIISDAGRCVRQCIRSGDGDNVVREFHLVETSSSSCE